MRSQYGRLIQVRVEEDKITVLKPNLLLTRFGIADKVKQEVRSLLAHHD